MIRRKEDHIRFDKQIAGGPGLAQIGRAHV